MVVFWPCGVTHDKDIALRLNTFVDLQNYLPWKQEVLKYRCCIDKIKRFRGKIFWKFVGVSDNIYPSPGKNVESHIVRTMWKHTSSCNACDISRAISNIDGEDAWVVKNYTVGIKYVSFICYPTRDSNGEKRAKAKFNDVACPNTKCSCYGVAGKGNVTSNGTSKIKSGGRVRKFICSACGTVFCSRKNTVFYGLRTSPEKITLALDLSTKGLSVNKIAEVVKVCPVTVRKWTGKAASHCEKVNDQL